MKPNLFRSISNSLAERFPLLPRIRRSFWGLLLFCIMFLLIGFGRDSLTIPVKAKYESHIQNLPSIVYTGGVVTPGQLTIANPTILECILLQNETTDVDLLTIIFLAIGSIIIIWMVPKLHDQNFFRKDVSNLIRVLGYLMIVHGLLSIYRIAIYMPSKIEGITNNEFTRESGFPIMVSAEFYFALIVIALAGMYQRGIKLQQEQDLTV
jgi:hypothetical protein